MFPFRPSRAATALLELAEAMLAPDAFDGVTSASEPAADHADHPHRQPMAVERRRRPAPPQAEHACLSPLTRAARARERLRA